eukprot:jgi/Botrbrau1/4522/Bobra.60_2s0013.1
MVCKTEPFLVTYNAEFHILGQLCRHKRHWEHDLNKILGPRSTRRSGRCRHRW